MLPAEWMGKFLDRAGRPERPDGRPLYAYRATAAEFDDLREQLRSWLRITLPLGSMHFAAALCLYVSEWYKRQFAGGQWSWERPLDDIRFPNDVHARGELTELGLRYFRRPLLKSEMGHREFLLSLVVEGGIPTLFATKEGAWLSRYIECVIRVLERGGDRGLDHALEYARFHIGRVPTTFQIQEIAHLVARIACEIAELRRHLDTSIAGLDPIALLDAREPQWRDRLPIDVADHGVRRLVEGLVRVKFDSRGSSVGIQRVLLNVGAGEYAFGACLQFSGVFPAELIPEDLRSRGDVLRARLLPGPMLAERCRSALAVLDCPNGDEREWTSRSIIDESASRGIRLPMDEEVTVFIAACNREFGPITLPGGQRLTGEFLVFRPVRPEQAQGREVLELVGEGSVRSRDKFLYVALPSGLVERLDAQAGETESIGSVEDYALYRVSGVVAFTSSEGLRYRVATRSQEEDGWQLDFLGEQLPDVTARVPVFRGLPRIRRRLPNGLIVNPAEMPHWRPAGGGAAWAPIDSHLDPLGMIEIIDRCDGVVQSHARIGVVPRSARIECRQDRAGSSLTALVGFGARSVLPPAETGVEVVQNAEEVVVRRQILSGTPKKSSLDIRWANGANLTIEIPTVRREACVFDGTGNPIANRAIRSAPSLRGASIEAPGSGVVRAYVHEKGRRNPILHFERSFARSLPFVSIRQEVESMLAASRDLDAEIRLELSAGFGADTRLDVRRYELELVRFDGNVAISEPSAIRASLRREFKDMEVRGRPFEALTEEEHVLPAGAEGFHSVPDGRGPWLVYASHEGVVRSRPLLVPRANFGPYGDIGRLRLSMLEHDRNRRDEAIRTCLIAASGADGQDVLRELLSLIVTFAGYLPLQSLDCLVRLADHTDAAVHLLLFPGAEDHLARILSIEDELPFLWASTSVTTWMNATEQRLKRSTEALRGQLAALLPPEQIEGAARARIGEILNQIALTVPSLAPQVAWGRKAVSLEIDPALIKKLVLRRPQAAEETRQEAELCIKRNGERLDWPQAPRFRETVHNLPSEHLAFSETFYTVLDAPHVAAQLAIMKIARNDTLDQGIRVCRTFDPAYFDGVLPIAMGRLMVD